MPEYDDSYGVNKSRPNVKLPPLKQGPPSAKKSGSSKAQDENTSIMSGEHEPSRSYVVEEDPHEDEEEEEPEAKEQDYNGD